MRFAAFWLVIVFIVALLTGCGGSVKPHDGCKGHGGVQRISNDATNSKIPVACKDGFIAIVHM